MPSPPAPRLLKRLPRALFQPLASPGGPFYVTLLLALFRDTQSLGGLVARSRAQEHALSLLEDDASLESTEHLEDEEPGFGWSDEATSVDRKAKRTARAGAVLRYLERCGWLQTEMQTDFRQAYLIPDYAFRFLGVFDTFEREESLPLQGLVCAIHDLVSSAVREGSAHVRLPEAQRQLAHLHNLLAELYHNMGRHLEEILQRESTAEVLRHFLTGYREEVIDKAYHQLRTTDHVSRFRPAMLSAFERLLEEDLLASTANAWARAEKAADPAPFREGLSRIVMEMGERLEALDARLEALDVRHGQFVDAAVRMVERNVLASSTTSGHVHALLETLVSEDFDFNGATEVEGLGTLVDLFEMGYVDSLSQARPRRAAEKFEAKETRRKPPTRKEVAAARGRNVERLLRALSPERVKAFADKLLALKDPIRASEIPLSGPEELPMLIYLRVHGSGRNGYRATTILPHEWIRVHDVGFRDFLLTRA